MSAVRHPTSREITETLANRQRLAQRVLATGCMEPVNVDFERFATLRTLCEQAYHRKVVAVKAAESSPTELKVQRSLDARRAIEVHEAAVRKFDRAVRKALGGVDA